MSEVTQQLEAQADANKKLVELRDRALRLSSNADFRALILDDYMVYEAARLTVVAGDPTMSTEDRAVAVQMALAAGHLKRYLSTVMKRGAQGEAELPQIAAALDEVRAEEVND